MKKTIALLLLLLCSVHLPANNISSRPLPNPFTDLPGYMEAASLPRDWARVAIRNDFSGHGTIEAIDGLDGVQLTEPIRTPDVYSAYFPSRATSITLYLNNAAALTDARLWVNGVLVHHEVYWSPYTITYDLSEYPADAWLDIEVADAQYW